MTGPLISVALTGDDAGFIIAAIPKAPCRMGERLVTGDVRRISGDGEPERWKAWLWPAAGGDMDVTQSCGAAEAESAAKLRELLQKRAGRKGAWWA